MVGPSKFGTIDATGSVILGEAASARVCSWLVQLDADGSWIGSCQPVGRAVDCRVSTTGNLAYRDMTSGDMATAALTTDALVLIDGSGMEVSLDFTVTGGSLTYQAVPLVG